MNEKASDKLLQKYSEVQTKFVNLDTKRTGVSLRELHSKENTLT